jgi:chromosome partitioning protein
LIIPMPPKGMDFSSSAQFWSLFTSLSREIDNRDLTAESKTWQFINILLSIVDANDSNTGYVTALINETYGQMVVPVEIPKTSVATASGAEFGTVYDITKYSGSTKTYERARTAYDRVVDLLELQIRSIWNA